MALMILLAFLSLVVSVSAQRSLPDVQPVALSCRCICYNCMRNFPPVILLHGVADSHRTWHGINRVIAIETRRKVCTCDARNHGTSPWTDDFDFNVLAVDLNHWMEKHHISKAILVGHSMGGVTAMKFALAKPEKVEKLIVEDFPPRLISPEVGQGVLLFIKVMKESLRAIPNRSNLKSAKFAVANYIRRNVSPEVAIDIVTEKEVDYLPLIFDCGVYKWMTNLDALIKSFEKPDSVLAPFTGEYSGDTLFIYGTKSPLKVYEGKDETLKLFPKAQFHTIEGASHYIHPRYPEFLSTVLKFIKDD